jgi:prepilin-type N-terminal cleavage/methylation domain-containing protein
MLQQEGELGADSRRASAPARSGFSLVELCVALVVILIAIGGLTGSVLSSMRLARATEETAIADEAVSAFADSLANVSFDEVFAIYNEVPEDDPGGEGSASGSGFDVLGLAAQEGDTDGFVGRVVFPFVDAPSAELREDIEDPRFGMPLDLNADDELDSLDHAADYAILPIAIRLEWLGAAGPRFLETVFVHTP